LNYGRVNRRKFFFLISNYHLKIKRHYKNFNVTRCCRAALLYFILPPSGCAASGMRIFTSRRTYEIYIAFFDRTSYFVTCAAPSARNVWAVCEMDMVCFWDREVSRLYFLTACRAVGNLRTKRKRKMTFAFRFGDDE